MKTLDIDFDYMNELAERASRARAAIKMLERAEEIIEAQFMQRALTDRTYWYNDRAPTQVILKNVHAKIGFSEADTKIKEELAQQISEAYGEWVETTQKLQICRDKISIFQTESANRRETQK